MPHHISQLKNNSENHSLQCISFVQPSANSDQLSHLQPLDVSSPPNGQSRITDSSSLHRAAPSPLLFQNTSPIASPPLCRFSPWFTFNSEADTLKIHHRRWVPSSTSPPNPFLVHPPVYKRHRESRCPPPHSSHVLPMKNVARRRSSPPPSQFRYPSAPRR
jgi:hypothetical protein